MSTNGRAESVLTSRTCFWTTIKIENYIYLIHIYKSLYLYRDVKTLFLLKFVRQFVSFCTILNYIFWKSKRSFFISNSLCLSVLNICDACSSFHFKFVYILVQYLNCFHFLYEVKKLIKVYSRLIQEKYFFSTSFKFWSFRSNCFSLIYSSNILNTFTFYTCFCEWAHVIRCYVVYIQALSTTVLIQLCTFPTRNH